MKYADLMSLRHLYLLGSTEPEPNSLRLYFGRTMVVPEPLVLRDSVLDNAGEFVVDQDLPVLQVDFKTYVAYSVRNESFTVWDEAEEFQGASCRTYTKSKYLDFVKGATIADELFPGPHTHYGMCCFDHIVDVVSADEPQVTEVAYPR